ncbi:MAG TPA: DUF4345 family protein [Gemmatimonadales bacterium]|nr:DUF4345 family protein [Gemmatimonadales bacterium]
MSRFGLPVVSGSQLSALSRAVLLLTGIGFLVFGAAAALAPSRTAGWTQLVLPTPSARIDFAATYGGFQLGFGLFLIACTQTQGWIEPGLWAAVAALAGFAVVRLLGILRAGGRVHWAIWFALALEVAGAALNLWGLRHT